MGQASSFVTNHSDSGLGNCRRRLGEPGAAPSGGAANDRRLGLLRKLLVGSGTTRPGGRQGAQSGGGARSSPSLAEKFLVRPSSPVISAPTQTRARDIPTAGPRPSLWRSTSILVSRAQMRLAPARETVTDGEACQATCDSDCEATGLAPPSLELHAPGDGRGVRASLMSARNTSSCATVQRKAPIGTAGFWFARVGRPTRRTFRVQFTTDPENPSHAQMIEAAIREPGLLLCRAGRE